jgi:hypothetical protein
MSTRTLFVLLCSLVTACGERNDQAYKAAGRGEVAAISLPAEIGEAPPERGRQAQLAMIIRQAGIALEVADIDSATAVVRRIATEDGGRVERLAQSGDPAEARQASMTLRVPAGRLDEVLERLRAVGKVEGISLSEADVTGEYVDVDAELRNLRRLEERLLALLRDRTGKLEEVLAVERELARVRQEIDVRQGRMNRMEQDIAWSSVQVDMHEPMRAFAGRGTGGWARLGRAFVRAWENFFDVVVGLIEALGVIIPLAVLGTLGWWAYRKLRRRLSTAQVSESPSPPSQSSVM